MRKIFAIIEQQRVSRDKLENFAAPDPVRAATTHAARLHAESEAALGGVANPTMTVSGGTNAMNADDTLKRTLTIVDESGNPVPGNNLP